MMRGITLLILLFSPSLTIAQSHRGDVSEELVTRVVDSVAALAEARYVFPDTGRMVGEHLRKRLHDGAFSGITQRAQLADRISREMQRVNGDRHLYVTFGAGASSGGGPRMVMRRPGSSASETDPAVLAARRANFDFHKVERLAGNVGYLSLGLLSSRGSNEAFEVIDAAMAFLGRVDAMVIDLRRTAGGEPRMADYLASYFFERAGQPTLTSYMRAMDRTMERTTVTVGGRQRPHIPLYLLVGRGTASGGEDFAFILKQAGRASLVGDTTAGAGRLTGLYSVGDGFSVSISGGRTWDPRTGKEWERTGIAPDVIATGDPLVTAHAAALQRLASTSSDTTRSLLEWTRRGVLARANRQQLDEAYMKSLAGDYDLRLVRFGGGRLWYQRDHSRPREELIPVSSTEFLLGEATRVEFLRQGDRVVAMRITAPGTLTSTFPRTE
jgi:retinol-binding protein 3